MSMSFSILIVPWQQFAMEFADFVGGRSTYDEFWSMDPNFHDWCDEHSWIQKSGLEHGYAHSYDTAMAFSAWSQKVPDSDRELQELFDWIGQFLVEGSPGIHDFPDQRVLALDVVYASYSPERVQRIAAEGKRWMAAAETILARLPDPAWPDRAHCLGILQAWTKKFHEAAQTPQVGVLTLLC